MSGLLDALERAFADWIDGRIDAAVSEVKADLDASCETFAGDITQLREDLDQRAP